MAAKRILILEDDTRLLKLYQQMMTGAGYNVDVAISLDDAYTLLAENPYDLLLVDIHLGDEESTPLLAQKARLLTGNGTRVIAISADMAARKITQDLGVTMFVDKPIKPRVLLSIVQNVLKDDVARL